MRRPALAAGALLLLLLGCGNEAGAAGCQVSTPGLAFGRYEPLTFAGHLYSSVVTSDASVAVVCTGMAAGAGYTIALGPSMAGPGDRINLRYLPNGAGGDELAFNIYRDPAYSTIWGDGVTAGSVLAGTIPPGDSIQSHTVYGRIPAGQRALRAGVFAGSMTMTLSFLP